MIARDGAVVAGLSVARAGRWWLRRPACWRLLARLDAAQTTCLLTELWRGRRCLHPEAVSSLTASTRPVGMSTTTGATTSEPSLSTTTTSPRPVPFDDLEIAVYPVPAGSRPHDVAPAADGGVWYTAQRAGALGHLDPVSGRTRHIALGAGSAPHGVIVDGEGIAWVTDGGLNVIVSVDPDGDVVTVFPLPETAPDANLNTAAFAADGRLWFTGQTGFHGVLDPNTGEVQAFESPRDEAPMASRRRRMAGSSTPPWPGATSARSHPMAA